MTVDPIRWVAGKPLRITAVFLDASGAPLTGLSPTAVVQRSSDNYYLKANGTWQAAAPTGADIPALVERNSTKFPGRYYLLWTPTAKVWGVWYDVLLDGGATADNRYWDLAFVTEPPESDLSFVKYLTGSAHPGRLEIRDPVDDATELAVMDLSEDTALHTLERGSA